MYSIITLLTEITAAQNECALSPLTVLGLYLLAIIFVTTAYK